MLHKIVQLIVKRQCPIQNRALQEVGNTYSEKTVSGTKRRLLYWKRPYSIQKHSFRVKRERVIHK